jgi:NAD(P)-dependent dehydrogenase (short-subunit alcohol dehydrogenase family)
MRRTLMRDVKTGPTIVVGASRGFGRAIALRLAEEGASVVAIARDAAALSQVADPGNGSMVAITAVPGDAAHRDLASTIYETYAPTTVVLVAGAVPPIAPLHEQTWESFSVNWETDVHLTFNWLREALLRPLVPGSRVIVFSSGAALAGSPMSGGYAGAKATQRLMTNYAADESQRAGLGVGFTSVLPVITPLAAVGKPAVVAYAAQRGISEEEYVAERGPVLTPEAVGDAVLNLAQADDAELASAYRLSGAGLAPLS